MATKDVNHEIAVYASHLLELHSGVKKLSQEEFSSLLKKKAQTLSITLSAGEAAAFWHEERKGPTVVTFPSEGMVGSLGDFARLMARGTEVPEEFYFGCGLTLLGAVCGTRLSLEAAVDAEARLYTILLGESYDVKKSTALRRSVQFFQSLMVVHPMPAFVFGAGSAEGLARTLAENPQGVVLAYDELQSFVEKAKVQSSVLLPLVASLFEGTSWDNVTKSKRSLSVRDAHLTLLGCCTTDTYGRMWTSDAIAIGFPNRLFIVQADRKGKVCWPERPDLSKLDSIRQRIMKQLGRLPLKLNISTEGKERWQAWYESLPSSEHTKRLDTIGFRLLILIALITDKDAIDLETVQVVTNILDYELQVRVLTDPIDADNRIAKLEARIRRQLEARGPLTVRELRRYTNANRDGLWAFDRASENLRRAQEIGFDGHRLRRT